MKERLGVLAIVVWTAVVASSVPRAEPQQPHPTPPTLATSTADLHAALKQYCVTCHNQRNRTTATASGVVLDSVDLTRVADEGAMWEKVVRKLRAGAMPPAGSPRPDPATHAALVSFLESTLDRAGPIR